MCKLLLLVFVCGCRCAPASRSFVACKRSSWDSGQRSRGHVRAGALSASFQCQDTLFVLLSSLCLQAPHAGGQEAMGQGELLCSTSKPPMSQKRCSSCCSFPPFLPLSHPWHSSRWWCSRCSAPPPLPCCISTLYTLQCCPILCPHSVTCSCSLQQRAPGVRCWAAVRRAPSVSQARPAQDNSARAHNQASCQLKAWPEFSHSSMLKLVHPGKTLGAATTKSKIATGFRTGGATDVRIGISVEIVTADFFNLSTFKFAVLKAPITPNH